VSGLHPWRHQQGVIQGVGRCPLVDTALSHCKVLTGLI
jgi:hypothetical protein